MYSIFLDEIQGNRAGQRAVQNMKCVQDVATLPPLTSQKP